MRINQIVLYLFMENKLSFLPNSATIPGFWKNKGGGVWRGGVRDLECKKLYMELFTNDVIVYFLFLWTRGAAQKKSELRVSDVI